MLLIVEQLAAWLAVELAASASEFEEHRVTSKGEGWLRDWLL
jgi:hypothetical protein